jgi:hypothetical protein
MAAPAAGSNGTLSTTAPTSGNTFFEMLGLGLDQLSAENATGSGPLALIADTTEAPDETEIAQMLRALGAAIQAAEPAEAATAAETETPGELAAGDDKPATPGKKEDKEDTKKDAALEKSTPLVLLPVVELVKPREAELTLAVPTQADTTPVPAVASSLETAPNVASAPVAVEAPTDETASLTPKLADVTAETETSAKAPVVITGRLERQAVESASATTKLPQPAALEPIATRTQLPSATQAKTGHALADRSEQSATRASQAPTTEAKAMSTPKSNTGTSGEGGGQKDGEAARQPEKKTSATAQTVTRPARTEAAAAGAAATVAADGTVPSSSLASARVTQPAEVSKVAEVQEPAATTGPVKDLSVSVASPDGGEVNLRFVATRGDVNLTVRTADDNLAGALRSELPRLENQLETGGWRSDLQATTSSAAREVTRSQETTISTERNSVTRAQVESTLRTNEAGMQFGAGGQGGHGNREAAEQEEDFLAMTALRRLSNLGAR